MANCIDAVALEDITAKASEAVAEALGDAYDCTRVWSAWSYGTMGPDDFSPVADDLERTREIASAAVSAILARLAEIGALTTNHHRPA